MFCIKCRSEFKGLTSRCPDCKILLVRELAPLPEGEGGKVRYEDLVSLVKKNGGQLEIDLSAADIGIRRRWSFPYLGFGFAWVKRMQGASNGTFVDLATTETGMEKKRSFPFFGFRFAWAKKMEGYVGGNEITLIARKVSTERKWSFPYFGYGYAWAQEMSGECGSQIAATLRTTDVYRHKEWSFPYLGYGFAWANRGALMLVLKE